MHGNTRDDISHDHELLARLREGDPSAFDIIYLRYYARLAIFAERIASGVDPADLVQDVFLSLWEGRARRTIVPPIAAYLYTAVRNRAITMRQRAENTARHISNFVALQPAPDESSTTSDPEQRFERAEVRAALRGAIGNLPERQQLALRLHLYERLGPAAIAEALGIQERVARKLLTKAMTKLCLVLEQVEG